MRYFKFRAWDKTQKRFTQSGVQFDNTNMRIQAIPHLILMQYTGLDDADGVAIYEGDKVHTGGLTCIVEWDEATCRFLLRRPGRQTSIPQTIPLTKMEQAQYKVAGHIYD